MTLQELQIKEGLSNRAFNLCSDNDLKDIKDIVQFYKIHGDFKRLRRCGVKTSVELASLSQKYENIYEPSKDFINEENEFSEIIQKLKSDNIKSELLKQKANLLAEKLSVRAVNCILSFTESKTFDIWKFIDITMDTRFSFWDVRNVGTKTVKELTYFKSKVFDLLNDLGNQQITSIDLFCSELSVLLGYDFNNDDEFRLSLENKNIDLLYFIDNYFLSSKEVSKREKHIIISLLESNCENDLKTKYDILSNKIGITRERSRQILRKMENEFHRKYGFIKRIFEYCDNLKANISLDYWEIQLNDNTEQKPLNYLSRSDLTLSNLLKLLFDGESYFVINTTDKIKSRIGPSPYDRLTYVDYKYLKLHYLVSKRFIDKKILIGILEKVYTKLIDRVEKDFIYSFDNLSLSINQKQFVTKLVSDNFELEKRGLGVLIKRNTVFTASEKIEEILKDNNDLMTAEEIQDEYSELYPNSNKPITSIRGALNDERFIYFRGNGPSRYGLKEWEHERGLRPGSIKSICFDFINQKNDPVHLFELVQHVRKFRDTNMKSIFTNLKLDKKDAFTFYIGNFIGIKGKNYSHSLINSFKNPSPQDANHICSFLKNHRYYDYKKLIIKFTEKFDLKPIQVHHMVHTKCSEDILRIKDERIYYNMTEEDALVYKLFNDPTSFKISDFNPYKIDVDQRRLISRLVITTENKIILGDSLFEFSKYDFDQSELCSVIFYHKSLKQFIAFVWKTQETENIIKPKQFSFSYESGFKTEKLTNSLLIHRFCIDNINSFELAIKNSFGNDTFIDFNYDLSIFDVKGMSRIDAYSKIITTVEKEIGKTIDLLEAKELYELLEVKRDS